MATYVADVAKAGPRTILDVGSQTVLESKYSYRVAAELLGLHYTGLDLEAGRNVDIVPANPYIWDELERESFDYIVSGQAFEHNPFMWITFAEMARVLKPGGLAFVAAPSSGPVHRWPFDCWRFYPDSWPALCALTALDLVESIRETAGMASVVRGGRWFDSVAIVTKAQFPEAGQRDAFYQNLAEIVAPFKARRFNVTPAKLNAGKCFAHYMQSNPRARIRADRLAKRRAAK